VSVGEIAALIAAVVFAVLVALLAVPILKAGRRLDDLHGTLVETNRLIASVNERTQPLLDDLDTTVRHVNGELERVDAITANVQTMSSNVSALSTVFAATLGGPVVRIAALSYGLRKAASRRRRGEATKRVDAQLRDDRRSRRHSRRRGGRRAGSAA
jgi:uncharacterized protein YoxC